MFKKTVLWMLILSFVMISISFNLQSAPKNNKQIPQQVVDAFNKDFPDIKKFKFSKETEKDAIVYQAEFKMNARSLEALYSPEGKLIQLEEEIANNDVPPLIAKYIKDAYKNFKIDEASKIMKTLGAVSGYDIEIKNYNIKKELEFDADGKFLREH